MTATKRTWSTAAARRAAYDAMREAHAQSQGIGVAHTSPETYQIVTNAALDRLHGMAEIVAIVEGIDKAAVMEKVRGY